MTGDELRAIGAAIYGEDKRTAGLAEALNVNYRMLQRWVAGAAPIPAGVANDACELLETATRRLLACWLSGEYPVPPGVREDARQLLDRATR